MFRNLLKALLKVKIDKRIKQTYDDLSVTQILPFLEQPDEEAD